MVVGHAKILPDGAPGILVVQVPFSGPSTSLHYSLLVDPFATVELGFWPEWEAGILVRRPFRPSQLT